MPPSCQVWTLQLTSPAVDLQDRDFQRPMMNMVDVQDPKKVSSSRHLTGLQIRRVRSHTILEFDLSIIDSSAGIYVRPMRL